MTQHITFKIEQYLYLIIDIDDIDSIVDLFKSGGFLTCGPKVKEFEKAAFLLEKGNKKAPCLQDARYLVIIYILTIG